MGLRFKVAPLSGTFMLVAILGFLFSTMFLWNLPGGESYALALAILFSTMFIASVISMTYAPVEDELAIDEHHTQIRKVERTIVQTNSKERKEIMKSALKNSTKLKKNKSKKK